ncbi:MAG: hypothetical protein E5X98_08040, partial [Mesorhizobium sp.]
MEHFQRRIVQIGGSFQALVEFVKGTLGRQRREGLSFLPEHISRGEGMKPVTTCVALSMLALTGAAEAADCVDAKSAKAG